MYPSYIANHNPVRICLAESKSRNTYYSHEILFGYYHILYGLWRLERTWGGGAMQQAELEYEFLEFAKYGIYGKIYDNQIADMGKIRIIDRQAGSLIISLCSDGFIQSKSERIFHVYLTSDTLILQEPCCDGCSTLFTRISDRHK